MLGNADKRKGYTKKHGVRGVGNGRVRKWSYMGCNGMKGECKGGSGVMDRRRATQRNNT